MRFTFTIGRFVVYDFTLFEIKPPDDSVTVIHHYQPDEDEEEDNGPGNIFGGSR